MNATVASQTMPSISGKMSYNVDFFETDFWSVPMQPFLWQKHKFSNKNAEIKVGLWPTKSGRIWLDIWWNLLK